MKRSSTEGSFTLYVIKSTLIYGAFFYFLGVRKKAALNPNQPHPRELRDDIARAISDLVACHSLPELVVAVRSSAVE